MEDKEEEVGKDMQGTTVCFADDTTVLLSSTTDTNMQKIMELSSEQFGRYFSSVGMKVNPTKEEHLCIYPRGFDKELEDGVTVRNRKEATSVKLLGITVSQGYSFTNHCSKIISKASQRIGHVKRLRKHLTNEKLQQVTDSIVMSVIRFGLEWAGRDRCNLVRLQKTLNVALRMLTGSSKYQSVRWMLMKTDMLNVKLQFTYQRMALMRRCLMTETTPMTMAMIQYPKEKSRTGHYRSRMGNSTKYGDNSIVTTSLEMLNSIGYGRAVKEKGSHPGGSWFKTKSTTHLKSILDNGNLY